MGRRETEGRQEGDKRETRGRQKGDRRETRGRQEGLSDLVARAGQGWVGLGRAGLEPTAVADRRWGGREGTFMKIIPWI